MKIVVRPYSESDRAALVGAGVHPLLVSGAIIWGVLVIALGMTQMQILPGQFHWIVQVVHLGFGLVAIEFAELMARHIRKHVMLARPGRASVAATPSI